MNKVLMYPENLLKEIDENLNDVSYLEKALDMLTPKGKEVMLLLYRDRLTQKEVSIELSISTTRVKTLKSMGIRRLRTPEVIDYIRGNETERLKFYEKLPTVVYNSLRRKGLKDLDEVKSFIEDNGDKWYEKIPDMGKKRSLIVLDAIKSIEVSNE